MRSRAISWVATSGSTGALKWVALSRAAVLASAGAVNRHLGADSKDRWAHALPDFHVGGLGIHARAQLSGAAILAFPRWEAAGFHAFCLSERATLTALVPAQLHDLIALGLPAPPSLRAVVVGGGALSESRFRLARGLGYPVLSSYGATECASQIATSPLGSETPVLEVLPHFAGSASPTGASR